MEFIEIPEGTGSGRPNNLVVRLPTIGATMVFNEVKFDVMKILEGPDSGLPNNLVCKVRIFSSPGCQLVATLA